MFMVLMFVESMWNRFKWSSYLLFG